MGHLVAGAVLDQPTGVERAVNHGGAAAARHPHRPHRPTGMEHRCGVQERAGFGEEAEHEPHPIDVERLRTLGVEHPLRQSRRATGVHQHGEIVFVHVDDVRRARRDHVVVAHVVGHVTVAEQHHRLQRRHVGAQLGGDRGERRVDVQHPRPRVAQDELQLLRRETGVERVDHSPTEERRVPEVDVVPAVPGEDREAVLARPTRAHGGGHRRGAASVRRGSAATPRCRRRRRTPVDPSPGRLRSATASGTAAPPSVPSPLVRPTGSPGRSPLPIVGARVPYARRRAPRFRRFSPHRRRSALYQDHR